MKDKIGIIDADLLDKGTNFPNLALMKISSYFKNKGKTVDFLMSYNNFKEYDKVYVGKVFDFTKCVWNDENKPKNVILGGSGFYFDKASFLDSEIEHSFPDYSLYPIEAIKNIKSKHSKQYYSDFSIGFLTRGCFRKCQFCINRNYNKVEKASDLSEFVDETKAKICLLDDNFWGYKNWKEEFLKLNKTNKKFQFKQGLDIRLLTEEKAELLVNSKYEGDYIFAFDNYEEMSLIKQKLELWVKYWKKRKHRTKFYVLCAFKDNDIVDLVETFERVRLLLNYSCYPYIMKHKNFKTSKWRSIYTALSGWCNQPRLLTKMRFKEYTILKSMGDFYKEYRHDWNKFLEDGHKKGKGWRVLEQFEKEYPEIAKDYFDMQFKNDT